MRAPAATRPNWMEIDLPALDHNYRELASRLEPGTRVIASVKGNAYGLGMAEIATRLVELGVHALTTGSYEDALAVRRAGLGIEIVMFGGALPAAMATYLGEGLVPTVHNWELAAAVSAAARRPTKVYVKVDCGHGRLGIPLRSASNFILTVASLPNVEVEGVYTHLPFTDADGLEWARSRLERFDELIGGLRRSGLEVPVTQARSSAGVLAGLKDSCNAVAPGGVLYGKSPLPSTVADASMFRPVLKAVRSQLIHVSPDASDRTPGMHSRHAFKVTGATGVIPFGRADGNRAALAGNEAYMLVGGTRAPVLGVSSEHTVLDLSKVPEARVGDDVVVLGRMGDEEIRLEDVAAWQATSGSDILLTMSGRMPRVHLR